MGGWYKKTRNNDWVAGNFVDKDVMDLYQKPVDGLQKVDFIGIGCSMIHRDVLEKLEWRTAIDEYVKDKLGKVYYVGDCLSYCLDAAKLGFSSYMVGDIVCQHIPMAKKYS